MFKNVLIVGLGGFLGSVSRYITTLYMHKFFPVSFPIGTFTVNIIGCFLIGLFYGIADKGSLMSAEWRMFLTVGFCGGFTTFSTFAYDNLGLLRDQEMFYSALYIGISVTLGLLMAYLGSWLIKLI